MIAKTNWYHHKKVLKHRNMAICDMPLDSRDAGVIHRIKTISKEQPINNAISVGCGHAPNELKMVAAGIVKNFDLYDASEERIKLSKEYADKLGVKNKCHFYVVKEEGLPVVDKEYCLVYWRAALHHMMSTDEAVAWSKSILRPKGYFVMDDYIGPNHFQWTDRAIEAANKIRNSLPERFFTKSNSNDSWPRVLKKPNVNSVIQKDPTEAADSEEIIPSLEKHFPNGEVINLGGIVYDLALRGVFENFFDEDGEMLDLLLSVDDVIAEMGESHLAVAFCQK